MFRRSEVEWPRDPPACERMFQDDDLQAEYAAVLDKVLRRLGVDDARLELYGPAFD